MQELLTIISITFVLIANKHVVCDFRLVYA